jgi:hypothetical protein
MRTHIFIAIAPLALLLAWQPTDVVAQSQQVRSHSYNYCWQEAYNRGWERNTRGERRFIRNCIRGRIA